MRAAGMLDEERYGERLMELNQLYERVAAQGGIPEAILLAIGGDRGQAADIVREVAGDLFVAMDNCPHQVVLVGDKSSTDQAAERARQRGLIYEILPFDRAYHTPAFAPYAEVLRGFLESWITAPPEVTLYSCTTMGPYPASLPEIRRIAFEHWVRPIQFCRTIEAMYDDGVRVFVEVGPRGNLTAFVDDILRGRSYLAVPADLSRRSGVTQLNHLVGLLATHGVPMRLGPLYARRAPNMLDLDNPQDPAGRGGQRTSAIKLATGWPPMGISEETAEYLRQRTGGARAGTVASPEQGVADDETSPASPSVIDQGLGNTATVSQTRSIDGAMSAYLRTMERFLDVQEDIMLTYMAGDATGPTDVRAGSPSIPVVRRDWMPDTQSLTELPAAEPHAASEGSGAGSADEQEAPSSHETVASDVGPSTDMGTPMDASTIEQILLRLVSDKTGYPIEMLDRELDLEADLGIDSIKRVEILGGFQQDTGMQLGEEMERLEACRTLRAMSEFLAGLRDGQAGDDPATTSIVHSHGADVPIFPFVGQVCELVPGERMTALCEISLDTCPFLRDHTLGRAVSATDADLTGLPIMPFTVSMEMLAEAAATLVPGQRLIGMKDVRAYRWIALDKGSVTLRLSARRTAQQSEIHVTIRETEVADLPSSVPAMPIIEGTMVFAEDYSGSPPAEPFSPHEGGPSKWEPNRLYEEAMFHGATFRGVCSMDSVGQDGAVATLKVLPLELLARDEGQTLLTDPVLLDQPGQVVGFWAAQRLETSYLVFPFHLEALYLYGPPLPAGERVTCQARIALKEGQQIRSNLDVIRDDGRVWARFVGWEDRRFHLPRPFFRALFAPHEVTLSEPWPEIAELLPHVTVNACRLNLDSFPESLLTAHRGIWQRVLAHLVLGRREREKWCRLHTPQRRRAEWLLARVAAMGARKVC